jgi:hypothetical protein
VFPLSAVLAYFRTKFRLKKNAEIMKAVCHATAYILARDAEFNIALRQVLQTVSVTVCVKILQKRFQISFSTPVVSFHIAVTSPNPVILGGFSPGSKSNRLRNWLV